MKVSNYIRRTLDRTANIYSVTLQPYVILILIAMMFCTACQKDAMYDLEEQVENPTSQSEMLTPGEDLSPRKSRERHMVNDFAKTYDLIGSQVPNSNARGSHVCLIKCSSGVIYDSNKGASNNIDAGNMKCAEDNSDSFKGGDKFYYFKAKSSEDIKGLRRYTVTLSDLEDDLDLFIYTLDDHGYVRECKGVSITIGQTAAESIELTGLSEGFYLIVVDGWMENVTSSYALELICDVIEDEATPCWDLNGNGEKDLEEDVNVDHIVNEDDCIAGALKGVTYQDNGVAPGALTGSFTQQGISFYWTEKVYVQAENATYYYEYIELGRNQWVVYLRDLSRNIDVEVDIANKQVIAKMDGNAFASYEITHRFFHPGGVEIKAKDLTKVVMSMSPVGQAFGYLEKVNGTSMWREYNASETLIAEYEEVARDEWSVYVRDESRALDLRLDVYRKKVQKLSTHWSDLYDIIELN